MKYSNNKTLLISVIVSILFLWNCKNEDDEIVYPETTPIVEISVNETEIDFGGIIQINCSISENEKFVQSEKFYLDGEVMFSSSEFYSKEIELPTNTISLGEHVLKYTATDHRGNIGADSITIWINSVNPIVETTNVFNIGADSASVQGKLITTGGNATAWGICYNKIGLPTKEDNVIEYSGTDSIFTLKISNLDKKSSSFVRTWISNGSEYFYGDEIKFFTTDEVGTFVDDRDQKTYRWVKIGEQIWMSENLAWEGDGESVVEVNDAEKWALSTKACSYYYYDEETYKEKGMFYQFSAAQNACPTGWHLPSDTEWDELVQTVGGTEIAGKALKSLVGWKEVGNGTNESGFNAISTGLIWGDGTFVWSEPSSGLYGMWWMDNPDGEYATIAKVSYRSDTIDLNEELKYYHGRSVRCLKDN